MSLFAHFLVGTALAQTPSDAVPQSPAGSINSIATSFIPFILIMLVFYILLIRPQNKKAETHEKMLKSLKRGDRIVTAGGLHGKVVKILDDTEHLMIEIADGVQVKLSRAHVHSLVSKTEPSSTEDTEKKD